MKIFSSSGALYTRRQVSVKGIRALFGLPASRGLRQVGGEQPRPVERGQPEFLSRFGWCRAMAKTAQMGLFGASWGFCVIRAPRYDAPVNCGAKARARGRFDHPPPARRGPIPAQNRPG